jgi:hypothetical protein
MGVRPARDYLFFPLPRKRGGLDFVGVAFSQCGH